MRICKYVRNHEKPVGKHTERDCGHGDIMDMTNCILLLWICQLHTCTHTPARTQFHDM